MQTQTVVLNVAPGGVPPIVYATQNDNGRTVHISVIDGASGYSLSDSYTYVICGTKPSGTGFSYDDKVTKIGSSMLSFDVNTVMTAVAGPVRCGIIIYNGDQHVETLAFILQVQESALSPETIIDSNDFQSIIESAVRDYIEEAGLVIDDQLETSGAAADAKVTGDEIRELKSAIQQMGGGIPYTVKLALDTILQNVGFKNNDVYTDELAVFHAWATDNELVSICATFPQSVTVYDTDALEDLRDNLVVEANFESGASVEITDYELSGDLTVGTSVITVTYSNKTTTVSVTVIKRTSFVYVPTDGVLSEQNYISISKTVPTADDPTEGIIDGQYIVSTNGANWGVFQFDFKPAQFTTSAKLKATFSILSTFYLASGNTSSLGYIGFCVTDGTYSAAIGFSRYGSLSANIRPRIITSSTPSWVDSSFDFAVNTTHTVEIVVENNMQTIKLDDVAIITDQPLGEHSLTIPAKFYIANANSASASATQSISIDRLEYYIDEGVE